MTLSYFAASPVVWAVAMVQYLIFSRKPYAGRAAGVAARYAASAVLAMLPISVAGHTPATRPLIFAAASAFIYQLACPLLTRAGGRRDSEVLLAGADAAVGMLAFGMLSALLLIGGPCCWLVGPLELALLATVIVQATYFIMYGSAMDAYGFRLMTQTNTNEVIEFIRYYPVWVSGLLVCAIAGVLTACEWVNLPAASLLPLPDAAMVGAAGLACVIAACAGGRNSLAAHSGFVSFWLDKRDAMRRLRDYPQFRGEREKGIRLQHLGRPYDGPSTIVLVIGESANRDYMSAFADTGDRETTPWMSACSRDDSRHWTLFPNAYSCGMHTFKALEHGLTEKNQFRDVDFATAASIVDMARAAGRRVHWYSNQGHLGASLSQVSVIAEQADEAMWTNQQPGLPPYDRELLAFLDRVDPSRDNLVVLHLKGNHFSFENRYPAEAETWRPDSEADTRTTYMNSIRYVDTLLRDVWREGTERLNMKAMVYCSDHAIIPDRHRAPTFTGFGDVRIPLAVWTSEDFIASHAERYTALRANAQCCWTNDFLYDLMCGLMDVQSPRFDPSGSLAHSAYNYRREQLTVLDGTVRLAGDTE